MDTASTIGRGTFAGNTTITPGTATGTTVTDAKIGDELAAQIAAGKLPAPDANTLYMVHLPPSVTVTYPG